MSAEERVRRGLALAEEWRQADKRFARRAWYDEEGLECGAPPSATECAEQLEHVLRGDG